ncbi:unnamed protein product [Paramecium primaurelia]|uniref:Uncharacterized protein n=1 Tax=Paramecium primaurelia TaxID=5886 RepID=A0A8S1LUN7_PARPR|nr:unnamed protein product [Paramecium primaurelia]
MVDTQKELREPKCLPTENQIEQEYLIQQIKRIYLQEKEEIEDDAESKQQLGFFDVLNQKYKDIKNHDDWKLYRVQFLQQFIFYRIVSQIQLFHFVRKLQLNYKFQKKIKEFEIY